MKTYQEYVALGKAVIEQVNDRQMKICSYALKVCTIRHGGRSNGYYTITDYARDIGMSRKTLSEWLGIYRNVIEKLSEKQMETLSWSQAMRTNQYLGGQNTIDNKLNGNQRSKVGTKKSFTPDRVQKMHDSILNEKPFVGEFLSIVKQMNHAKTVLTKRDLSIIQESHLSHLMEILDECSDVINDYLTKARKAKRSA